MAAARSSFEKTREVMMSACHPEKDVGIKVIGTARFSFSFFEVLFFAGVVFFFYFALSENLDSMGFTTDLIHLFVWDVFLSINCSDLNEFGLDLNWKDLF